MLRKLLKPLLHVAIIGYVMAILIILVSCVTHCRAQGGVLTVAPDCCSQSINLNAQVNQLQSQLTTTRIVLDSTRAVTERILNASDERVLDLEKLADESLRRERGLRTLAEAKAASMLADNQKWVPRTKLGRFWRGKVMPALAIVGGVTISVLTLKILPR